MLHRLQWLFYVYSLSIYLKIRGKYAEFVEINVIPLHCCDFFK